MVKLSLSHASPLLKYSSRLTLPGCRRVGTARTSGGRSKLSQETGGKIAQHHDPRQPGPGRGVLVSAV